MLMGDGSQLTWDVNKFNDANNDGDNDSDNDDTLQMVTSTSPQSRPAMLSLFLSFIFYR